MKKLTLFSIFCCITLPTFAQKAIGTDTALKFNQRYTKCERKWVVMSKSDTSANYTFGYIYIDQQAGFTFDLKGTFKVDGNNSYIVDTTATKDGSIKYRISPNWRLVALLPPQHFKELHIKPQPDWLKYYYTYTDTVAHNYRWGYTYNDVEEPTIALTYLEPAYKTDAKNPDVAYEIAYAYNALTRYDDAVRIMEPAIVQTPGNHLFYKELGFAYLRKEEYEKAISTYKKGLEHFADKPTESRGELAYNIASIYKKQNNQPEYKTWMIKAKAYTPMDSRYYKLILDAGF